MSIDSFNKFCQTIFMTVQMLPDKDEKRGRILNAALSVFALYGYKRTSMEDIAKAASMSRAAVYQHFRNKEDILVHGVDAYFDLTVEGLRTALTPGRPLTEALQEACASTAGELQLFNNQALAYQRAQAVANMLAERGFVARVTGEYRVVNQRQDERQQGYQRFQAVQIRPE